MKRTELNQTELQTITGGDYWTDQGYTQVGTSQYFASNQQALSYGQNNAESLRKKYNAYSFAYLVQVNNNGYYLNYYTK